MITASCQYFFAVSWFIVLLLVIINRHDREVTKCIHPYVLMYIRKIDDIQSIMVDTSFVFHDIHNVLQKIRIIHRLVTVYIFIYIYMRILIICLLYIRDICFVPSGISPSLPVHRSKQQGLLNRWNYLWSPTPQDPWDDCIFTYYFTIQTNYSCGQMGVSKIGGPHNGRFIMEIPIKMDDLGGKPTIFGNTQIYQSHGLYG